MLTKKEKEILELRKSGFTQSDIAKKLKISQPAVSSFQNNAIRKIREAKKTMDFVKKLKVNYEE
jgi:Tfx family DNA-binding protein